MELFDILKITVYGETYDVYLNWIGKIIKFLIEVVGSVGIGIILFSLILKLIVLPFDIYQRVAMRKQNLKMKENQARMEKLQKQYANNKELYNQKVMEMYKENGISMFSSCLPMILSMVIFFVAIDAFNVYAQYASVHNYNIMVDAYHNRIEQFCPELTADTVSFQDSVVFVNEKGEKTTQENVIVVRADDKEVFYTLSAPEDYTAEYESEKLYNYIENTAIDKKKFYINDKHAEYNETKTVEYYQNEAKKAVLTAYNTEIKEGTGFLWIKNIWKPDASYEKPVVGWDKFSAELKATGCACSARGKGLQFEVGNQKVTYSKMEGYTTVYKNDLAYNAVTENLNVQKSQPNGYFILIALSIGTILLQQFVSMRSQKEQQQYATVDGQGASQQKMTMIIMTGMFAIFSFMYSSAFSIYMVTSNLFSLASTLIINKAVDSAEAKKEAKALQEKHNQRFPGRVSPKDSKENKKK